MPTRKQRRREAKLRRHEWEEVYVDAEGREVAADEVEETERPARNGHRPEKKRATASPRTRGAARGSTTAAGRRGAIFAPLMFVTVYLTSSDASLLQQALTALWLLAIFLPFSYFMDSFMYKRYVKRTGEAPPAKR